VTIAVEESVAGGGTTGDTSTLTSWTPASNELILLFVAMRDESITPTAAGNGITFSQIHKVNNVQNLGALTVFRGLDASPSTGQITVTHTGNTDTVSCIATRFSGIDTSGSNGSGAIGNTATDTGPDPDDDDMLIRQRRRKNKLPCLVSNRSHRQRTTRRSRQPQRRQRSCRISNRSKSSNRSIHPGHSRNSNIQRHPNKVNQYHSSRNSNIQWPTHRHKNNISIY
jgi:hypothetical protein